VAGRGGTGPEGKAGRQEGWEACCWDREGRGAWDRRGRREELGERSE
jgi:hypothetical protein